MRALIVDDEPLVIAAARMLVDWAKFNISEILEADCADAALRIIEEKHPEIVLSDIRMPGMSGLEFIRLINEKAPGTRTILITAYGDFAYAKEAIRLGCVEYILKPLQEEDLNNAVAKAVSMYESRQTLEAASSSSRTQDRAALWFGNNQDPELFKDVALSAPFFSGMARCRIGVITTRQLPDAGTEAYTLANTCHAWLFDARRGAAVASSSGDILLILNDMDGLAPAAADDLMSGLMLHGSPELHLGLSASSVFPDETRAALQEARINALSYNLLNHEKKVHRSALPVRPSITYDEMEKAFYLAILSGRVTHIRETVQKFTGDMIHNESITLRQLENFRSIYTGLRGKWILGFEHALGRTPAAGVAGKISFFPADGHFSMEYFRERLASDLSALAEAYVDIGPVGTGDTIYQVKNYIDTHYDDALSLEELADMFSMSSAHLSRSFKKEFGTGPIDYITRVRIETAKMLITNTRLKLSDIAAAVGYPDSKYFSRVFRRTAGTSPAEYRSQGSSGKEDTADE